jgi:hypothetical protein
MIVSPKQVLAGQGAVLAIGVEAKFARLKHEPAAALAASIAHDASAAAGSCTIAPLKGVKCAVSSGGTPT